MCTSIGVPKWPPKKDVCPHSAKIGVGRFSEKTPLRLPKTKEKNTDPRMHMYAPVNVRERQQHEAMKFRDRNATARRHVPPPFSSSVDALCMVMHLARVAHPAPIFAMSPHDVAPDCGEPGPMTGPRTDMNTKAKKPKSVTDFRTQP